VFCYRGSEASHVSLVGEYWSEGSDVLAAKRVIIPRTADQPTLTKLVGRFAASADAAVQASYAARLLRLFA